MIDLTLCLNVDRRWGERDRLRAEFARVGFAVEFFLAGDGVTAPGPYDHVDVVPPPRQGYPAWATRPNSYNAFLCFQKMVGRAKERGARTLLVLEDDASVAWPFDTVWPRALAELPADWDMLYLGANHAFSRTTAVSEHLLRLDGSGCWHAVCLRDSSFDAVLGLPMDGPIDQMCGRHLHRRLNCYAVWPSVVLPLPGFSHCEGREVDYTHFFSSRGAG